MSPKLTDQLRRPPLHPDKSPKEKQLKPRDPDPEESSSEVNNSSDEEILNHPPPPRMQIPKPPEIEVEKPDEIPAQTSRNVGKFIFISATIIGICALAFLYFPSPIKKLSIDEIVSNMKVQFPGQPLDTYKLVRSAMKTAVSERESPGIIILLSSKEAQETNELFAKHLAASFESQSDYIEIIPDVKRSAESLKEYIDTTLKNNFTENTKKAVLVRDLNHLPFEASLIFHNYCDHENAPFKKALYVITIITEEAVLSKTSTKHWDRTALEVLKSAWKNSDEDQVSSLISRLIGSVAAVVHEME